MENKNTIRFINSIPKFLLTNRNFNIYILKILRIDYSLLILSTNSSGVSISVFENPNHFLPKSLMDAPM